MKQLMCIILLIAGCSALADTQQPVVLPDGRTIVCTDYGSGVTYCN